MAKATKAARACVAREVEKHCHKKQDRCASKKERKQAVAIGFAVCRREGFRLPKRRRARR